MLSEFNKEDMIDGGYQEPNRIAAILSALRVATNEPEETALLEQGDATPEGMTRRIHVLRGGENAE